MFIEAFKRSRYYLEGTPEMVEVITDHQIWSIPFPTWQTGDQA